MNDLQPRRLGPAPGDLLDLGPRLDAASRERGRRRAVADLTLRALADRGRALAWRLLCWALAFWLVWMIGRTLYLAVAAR